MTDWTVLVTGGTGSLGSAFVRHALTHAAAGVVVLAHTEEHARLIKLAIPDPRLVVVVGDVRDADSLRFALRVHPVMAVVHAAAMKVVPICETFWWDAVQTNVVGTANVLAVAHERGVARVVSISSDKAVLPCSVYGATKTLTERLTVAAGFTVVRFGNFIGSTGSVLPIWEAQKRRGEPISVTDRTMTRFYLSVSDAAAFVTRVLLSGEGGAIYIPKQRACRLGALADAVSPQQTITGIRPGERLHEWLITPDEPTDDLGWAYRILPNQGNCGVEYRSDRADPISPAEVLA